VNDRVMLLALGLARAARRLDDVLGVNATSSRAPTPAPTHPDHLLARLGLISLRLRPIPLPDPPPAPEPRPAPEPLDILR